MQFDRLTCPVYVQAAAKAVIVREARRSDLHRVAEVHTAAFRGFTMTRLGESFLRKYYRLVLDYERHVFLLGEENADIVGFAAGFANPPAFYRLLRTRRFWLAISAAPQIARDPMLARDLRGGTSWASEQAASGPARTAELASIAVSPAAQQAGIGSHLVSRFCVASESAGATAVTLTTDTVENQAVRNFYERLGFVEASRLTRGNGREMIGYRKDLGSTHD